MTNAEANAVRPTEQTPLAQQQSSFSQDTVHNLYSSMSDLTKSEQNKQTPDWLPSSNTLLPSDTAQKNPNSNLADFLKFSPLSAEGGKEKIPFELAGQFKGKSGSEEDDTHSGTINPNSAPNESGSVGTGKDNNHLGRALSLEGIPTSGNVPGPGSKEPSGDQPPDYLRNPSKGMEAPPTGGDVPVLGGKAPQADRNDYTRTAAESEPENLEQSKKSDPLKDALQSDARPADGDKSSGKVNDNPLETAEARRAENAIQAADILSTRGDLGNEYQRSQVREMFRQAFEQGGPGAVADLARAINQELERRGSDVRVSANIDFPSLGSSDGLGYRIDVTKGSQKVDEMRVAPRSRWESYPDGRERLPRS